MVFFWQIFLMIAKAADQKRKENRAAVGLGGGGGGGATTRQMQQQLMSQLNRDKTTGGSGLQAPDDDTAERAEQLGMTEDSLRSLEDDWMYGQQFDETFEGQGSGMFNDQGGLNEPLFDSPGGGGGGGAPLEDDSLFGGFGDGGGSFFG